MYGLNLAARFRVDCSGGLLRGTDMLTYSDSASLLRGRFAQLQLIGEVGNRMILGFRVGDGFPTRRTTALHFLRRLEATYILGPSLKDGLFFSPRGDGLNLAGCCFMYQFTCVEALMKLVAGQLVHAAAPSSYSFVFIRRELIAM